MRGCLFVCSLVGSFVTLFVISRKNSGSVFMKSGTDVRRPSHISQCLLAFSILLLVSVPGLGVYYFFVVDSVCLSVTLLQIASSFLFLDGIEPFFGR